jgi:hypothetical protein
MKGWVYPVRSLEWTTRSACKFSEFCCIACTKFQFRCILEVRQLVNFPATHADSYGFRGLMHACLRWTKFALAVLIPMHDHAAATLSDYKFEKQGYRTKTIAQNH